MRFSCAMCGQRYSSVDAPKPGCEYRINCVACGGLVLLKGGDFPALPTAADPRLGAGQGATSDAAAEEPLGLALAPLATQQAGALPPGAAARAPSRTAARAPRLWLRIAAGSAVALATAGAGILLVFGGPAPAVQAVAPVEPPPIALPRDVAPATSDGPSGSAPAAALPAPVESGASRRPGAPSPGDRGPPPQPSPKARPGPRPPAPASPTKVAAPPPARRVASAPRPAPTAAAPAAPRPAAPESTPPASSRPPPDQMVSDTLTARRPAFEACLRDWLRDEPSSAIAGRQVDLLLMVNPNGSVTSPAVDDPAVDGTALGACLRGVVSRPFPAFEGDPLQVRMPLRLGQ